MRITREREAAVVVVFGEHDADGYPASVVTAPVDITILRIV